MGGRDGAGTAAGLSVFDAGAPEPCPAPFNMAAHVLARAGTQPDKVALAVVDARGARRWSYGRLEGAVRGVAGGLTDRGLAPGDRVLMRLGNDVEFPILFLACLAADLVPVPVSAQLTARELAALLPGLAPALIVQGEGLALPDPLPCPVMPAVALAAMHDGAPAPYAMGDPERPGYIVYTSGTSGRPRAVVHAHRAIWARRMILEGWYGLGPDDRLMHAGAFNWTYTLGTGLMDPWSVGATALIPGAGADRHSLPLLLRRHEASIFAAAPGVFRQILETGAPLDLPRLRHGLSAGEALPAEVARDWRARTGTAIHEALGMSECSTFISGSPAAPARPGTLGRPQTGRRVAVLAPRGTAPVPLGEPGLLAVSARDPGLMLGYRGAEAETRARFRGEWFVTGDMVRMEADGAIAYLGRCDDMMNAGGYRVSPLEVETALAEHPEIREAAATSVPVKAGAEVIAAFYTADHDIAEEALAGWCAGRLARYKCPRIFLRVAALPRGANGKLRRGALRKTWKGPE
ncbi:benzoate--CoA ligase [Maritimibacter sp. 55A14]|uniref:class I adenylate-forming enzyme family protein n=1 Tax=Maritimibacter sp. 55A14 TaxID=2174844 RepID=UPI000D61E118|nr:class I adenylate-forming enzyme family protein [Maritimibacter sp. 55A14]PWE33163.1 benzoate--CoA ligase [Maritimibacter sp. 55A14]